MRPDRYLIILGLALVFGGPARGQPPQGLDDPGTARRAQLAAAVDDGLAALRRDVYAAPFSVDLNVRQAASRLDAVDPIDRAIQTAEQRGGPRWRGDDDRPICEVRLELPGATVAAAIHEA